MSNQLILKVIAIFMLLSGLTFALDLTLVLCGYVIPVSYPEFDMSWNNSPIFHYNVSRAANTLIGAFAVMALYVGLFLVTQFRPVRSKAKQKQLFIKPQAPKKVDKWLSDQLN